jgi:hypothetical protein
MEVRIMLKVYIAIILFFHVSGVDLSIEQYHWTMTFWLIFCGGVDIFIFFFGDQYRN